MCLPVEKVDEEDLTLDVRPLRFFETSVNVYQSIRRDVRRLASSVVIIL